MDAVLAGEMAAADVPGAQAAILKGGEVVWVGNYGVRHLDEGTPVTDDTSFSLASISKTVTVVALMQAVEQGYLTLDDPVDELVGFTVRHPVSSDPILVRHLLTHTSGIRDNWDIMDASYTVGDPTEPLGDFLERYLDPDGVSYDAGRNFQDWAPGARYSYSNIGAALAGYLVEATTGVDFAQWCRDEIFEPLGMAHTGWYLADLEDELIAHPHACYGSCSPISHYGYPDYPDGMLRSTTHDMGRFMSMMFHNGSLDGVRIVTEDSVGEMLTVTLPSYGQALVWYSTEIGGEPYFGHDGGDVGVATEMFFRRSDGLGYALWMNGDPRGWTHVMNVTRALLETGLAKF